MNKNYYFFMKNRAKIIAGHENSYVVIEDEVVIEYFSTEMDALLAMKEHVLGHFIVQKCVKEQNDIVEFYTRRVVFA